MIALQSAIYSTLGQYAGLSALVGSRIYPDIGPQRVARPYIVWQEISLQQAQSMSGSAETGGLNNYHVQVTSWAESGTAAREVDYQARLAMIAASAFKSLLSDSRMLSYEPETKLHGAQSDFSIWIKS